MVQIVIRFVKRFAVLLPGILIAYLSVDKIYPFIDRSVPKILAILVTYGLAAYVLIPALIRLIRIFFPPNHLPLYSVTPDGFASDPVNIGVVGTREELIAAMQKAGWEVADDHSWHNALKELMSEVLGRPYPTAPMSSLYLFGRKQDIGFEIQIADKRGHRHHVRFWATTFEADQPLRAETIHWLPRTKHPDEGQTLLWLGAATRDIGIAFIRHNAQVTHMIHPDTDVERDLIVDQLEIDGAHLATTIQLRKPYKLVNRVWRGYLKSDGKLKICRLPRQKQTSSKAKR